MVLGTPIIETGMVRSRTKIEAYCKDSDLRRKPPNTGLLNVHACVLGYVGMEERSESTINGDRVTVGSKLKAIAAVSYVPEAVLIDDVVTKIIVMGATTLFYLGTGIVVRANDRGDVSTQSTVRRRGH